MIKSSSHFLAGVRAVLPLLLGVAPFGMIYGVLAVTAGIPPLLAQAMSAVVFAGSAQFVTAQMVSGGLPYPVIVMTAVVLNLRHALYSASVAPYLKPLRPAWRWALAYLLTDEAYAVAIIRYRRDPLGGEWYFLGVGLGLWACWQVTTAIGVLLGAQVPAAWQLDFTLPLTFIAIIVPTLTDRAVLAAAVIAGLVAVALVGLPFKLGLVVAMLAGIGVGLVLERP